MPVVTGDGEVILPVTGKIEDDREDRDGNENGNETTAWVYNILTRNPYLA